MVIKHTHHVLQIIFAVLIGYLLITRGFISWIQYAPDSFVESVEWVTDSQIEFEQIAVQQNWLGFQFQVHQLKVDNREFTLAIQHLDMDVNIFSMFIPTMKFGEYLTLENGRYLNKKVQQSMQDTFEWEGTSAASFEKLTEINLDINQLWQRVKVSDLVLEAVFNPDLTLHIYNYQSLKGSQLTVLSEFGIAYKGSLNFERFAFKSSFETNLLGNVQQGTVSFLSFQPLRVEALAQLLPTVWHQKLPKGELIIDLQAQITESSLTQLTLNLNAQALRWPQKSKTLPKHLGLELVWKEALQRGQTSFKDWRFRLSQLQLDNQYIETVSPIELNFTKNQLLTFQAEAFDIEPFKAIVKSLIPHADSAALLDKTSGLSIENLKGSFNWHTLQLPQLKMTIKQLTLPVTDYPGIALHNVTLLKAFNKVTLETNSPMILSGLNLPKGGVKILLPNQVEMHHSVDKKAWVLEPFDFTLDSMPITLQATGTKQGEIDAQLSIKVGSMETLKQYLPYTLFSAELESWLKMALVAGENIQAQVKLKGNLNNFPFQDGSGIFQVTASVEKTFLKFDPDWPMLENFRGEIYFTPYQLKITSPKIHVGAGNYAQAVEVVINHLDQKDIALVFKGQVSTQFERAMHYLTQSPLSALLGMDPFVKNTQFSGSVDVVLDRVWVPLSGYQTKTETVSGQVTFQQASMTLFEKIPLKKIQGTLVFTEQSASASKLSAVAFEHESLFSVQTNPQKDQILIAGSGRFLPQKNPFFEESIPWSLGINIPLVHTNETGLNVQLDLATDQVKSLLPAPFDSNTLKNSPFKVDIEVSKAALIVNAALPEQLLFKGVWKRVKGQYQIQQLNALLGEETSTGFKEGETDSYILGQIEKLNLDEWFKVIPKIPLEGRWKAEHSALHWVPSTIAINTLTFRENAYPNVQIEWLNRNLKTALQIKSSDVLANVVMKESEPIAVNVERLRLHAIESSQVMTETQKGTLCHPDQASTTLWPEIIFKGKKIELNGYLMDSLNFHLLDGKERLTITGLQGVFGQGVGHLTGQYLFDKASHNSTLLLTLQSNKVEEMLRFIQLKQGFTGKKAKVDANLAWQGALECFSTKAAFGQVNFELYEGTIDDIEPGFARLIGLLSVESLARRLKLDLKDVTHKGMVYDQIKGQAQLKSGILELESFGLKAPSASVALFGQVNLLQETFKLKAYVTPAIGASIPTIAALAGYANPLAALAVYTFMKVVPGINENLVTFRYDVRGSWSDPKVTASKSNLDTTKPLFDVEESILDTQR